MCPRILDREQPPTPAAPKAPQLVSVDGRTYPLQSAHVRARAEGGLALTTLTQRFANPYDEPLEVLYTMPLPADGAVLGYTIKMGDRVIRGEIESREKAEADYQKALFEGRTAGLLESDRADTFQQRLGNLPAGTDADIEIEVLHPVAFLAGLGVGGGVTVAGNAVGAGAGPIWEYRFPTVVGVRYQGAPGRVGDAGRLDVPREADGDIPTRVSLDLRIADALPDPALPAAVASPSHEITHVLGADALHVHLGDEARLDRDLVIQWPAASSEVGVRVVEGTGLSGDTGRYALLTVTPPATPAATFHRDLTILIDASGSMDGPPLQAAKRIAREMLESLGGRDRFEVLAFASNVIALSKPMAEVNLENVERCLQRLDNLRAGGSTEMTSGILAAMNSLGVDSQRQIVVLTDGYIGFEDEIVSTIVKRLPQGVRFHAVGIGSAPNRTLTSGIARVGRGVELIVGAQTSAAETAKRLLAATARPVLTDLTVTGSAVTEPAPARPRDVFAGQPVVVAVKLSPGGGMLDVSGRLAGQDEAWVWRTEISATATPRTDLPVGALYGRELIADLECGVTGFGGDLDEIVEAVALMHRIVSRRTSLVAIAEEPGVEPLAPSRRERLPVEMPFGVSAEGVGLGGPMLMSIDQSVRFREVARVVLSSKAPLESIGDVARHLTRKILRATSHSADRHVPAKVVATELDTVTFEVESPNDKFRLPQETVWLTGPDGASVMAMAVPEKSSPEGPHKAGLVLRLVVRLEEGTDPSNIHIVWNPGATVDLFWEPA